MNTYRKNIIITGIFLLLLLCFSFAIRIYKVNSAPSGFLIDEASIGYNAYSILKTGKDEHGISFPLVFKAFGDQKLPLYIYFVVPFIKYFGLSIFSVRLPSILAGSFLPVVIYFLLLEFGFKKKISFFGGIITAISPWTIILSRFGFETNIGLLFFSLGILFSFISLRKKSFIISIIGGLFFGLTMYCYVAYRFITPLIILSYFLLKINKKSFITKTRLIFFASFLIVILPLTFTLFTKESTVRLNQSSLNYLSGMKMEINENRTFCSQNLPKILCYSSSNKFIFIARTYLYRYINVFSPSYLFLVGNDKDHALGVDNFGLFYVWLLPFYVLGILSMISRFRNKRFTSVDIFVCFGLFVSVTPSLLAENPHILRLSALFPFIVILVSHGISFVEEYIKRDCFKKIFFIFLYVFSYFSLIFFLILFLTVHIRKYEITYGTYIPKLMKYLGQQNKNTQIFIRSITEGIIYYAYVNAVDPTIYQKKIIFKQPDGISFAHAKDLENIHITEESMFEIACSAKNQRNKTLFVSNENDLRIIDQAKKIIFSENGVDTIAIVYDLSKIDYDYSLCQKK